MIKTQTGKENDRFYRMLSLVVLVVQSSSLVLLMRYTRSSVPDDELYTPSTAVVLTELVKIFACLIIYYWINRSKTQGGLWRRLGNEVFSSDGMKLAVPAGLYALQNNMLYIALTNLDAATYQVTYQLKVLTTALFSVSMMNKTLTVQQWGTLVLLMVGVALVQLDQAAMFGKLSELEENDQVISTNLAASSLSNSTSILTSIENSAILTETESHPFLGFAAVLCSCFTSGFAGVYFEKVLKGSSTSLWVRNIQLGFFGALFSFVLMLLNDGRSVYQRGMLHGFNGMVILVILNQALGGLVVALVVRYSDQILKSFALSFSTVISCVVSLYMFHFQPTFQFIIGALMVVSSVTLYGFYSKKKSSPTNTNTQKKNVEV